MLLWLAQWLQDDISALRVVNYITFRAVMATLTAGLIGLFWGPWVIRRLTALKVGQAVRTDGPQTHLIKSGTPTMGGVLILLGIAISTLLWADLSNRFVWIVLIVTLGFGAIAGSMTIVKSFTVTLKGCPPKKNTFGNQSLVFLLPSIWLFR